LAVDACIHDGFVGFRSLDVSVSPEFLYNFLVAYRRHSAEQAVGATFQNLKTDQIREWVVPVPPENLQTRFQQIAREFRRLLAQQSAATAKAQAAFDALLAQVFSKQ
jgi:restriction endonuclease S subunit